MLLKNGLSTQAIVLLESADSAAQVIGLLAARMADRPAIHAERIEQAVLERERTRTTAFSNGAALPHCRLPDLPRFIIGLAILRKPVRWDTEGHAIDTVLMVAGPAQAISDHLRILANASQLLDSASVHARLRTAPDADSAYALLIAAEEAIEQRRALLGALTEVRRNVEGEDRDHLRAVAERFIW